MGMIYGLVLRTSLSELIPRLVSSGMGTSVVVVEAQYYSLDGQNTLPIHVTVST
jgi:hypothetical protein